MMLPNNWKQILRRRWKTCYAGETSWSVVGQSVRLLRQGVSLMGYAGRHIEQKNQEVKQLQVGIESLRS